MGRFANSTKKGEKGRKLPPLFLDIWKKKIKFKISAKLLFLAVAFDEARAVTTREEEERKQRIQEGGECLSVVFVIWSLSLTLTPPLIS